jgi:hypothetical protein
LFTEEFFRGGMLHENMNFRGAKTRLAAILFLTLLIRTASGVGPTCVTPPAGLIGWWPGEGNANDIGGNDSGTLQGGVSASVAGVVGTAFSFDGTSGYVQIPDSPQLRPANLTIEAWVRFSSLDSTGSGGSPPGEQYLVFKQNSRNGDFEGFDLGKSRVSGGDVFCFMVSSASGQGIVVNSTTFVSPNVWYHVAAVRGSNTAQLYVNGHLEGQTSVSFSQDYGNFPLYFGTSGQSYWDHKFSGLLDEVSLYNRALSASEIAAEYNAGNAGKCKVPRILTQPQGGKRYWGDNITLAADPGRDQGVPGADEPAGDELGSLSALGNECFWKRDQRRGGSKRHRGGSSDRNFERGEPKAACFDDLRSGWTSVSNSILG